MKKLFNFKFSGEGHSLACCNGFTLAEVLVTLGIIGVVSAMTVPTLMQNHQRKVYVTQLHKVYNEFSQAAAMMLNDNNAINLTEARLGASEQSVTTNSEAFIKKYFKVVNDCGAGPATPCFADTYTTLSGATVEAEWSGCHSFALANGSSVCMSGLSNGQAYILVDTNGASGPNIAGRDYWVFSLYNDAVIDEGVTEACRKSSTCDKENARKTYYSNCDSVSDAPDGCFGRLLNDNWEMTY